MFIFKTILRTGVIAGLAVGALAGGTMLIAGPQRAEAIFEHVQENAQAMIDRNIDDPTALRAQLRKLEATYPERISQLSSDLAEVRQQIARAERERDVAAKVVELADNDLARLEHEVAALRSNTSDNRTASATWMHQQQSDLRQANTRLNQIRQTRVVYASRVNDAGREVEFLGSQAGRLEEALTQLETERAQFQSQLFQIERQVDAIARNERLIEMMEERSQTLEELDRFEAVKLDHLTARLNELASRQEAQLQVLSEETQQLSYEDMAEIALDAQNGEYSTGSYESELEFGFDHGQCDAQPLQLAPVDLR